MPICKGSPVPMSPELLQQKQCDTLSNIDIHRLSHVKFEKICPLSMSSSLGGCHSACSLWLRCGSHGYSTAGHDRGRCRPFVLACNMEHMSTEGPGKKCTRICFFFFFIRMRLVKYINVLLHAVDKMRNS